MMESTNHKAAGYLKLDARDLFAKQMPFWIIDGVWWACYDYEISHLMGERRKKMFKKRHPVVTYIRQYDTKKGKDYLRIDS